MKTLKIQALIAMMLILTGWLQAQTTVGPFTFYPTNMGGTMQGQAQIDGIPAVEGDIIAAFNPGDTCVGAAELTIYGGLAYINFVIYGDDGDGYGMNPGEDFDLKLYDASAGETIEYGVGLSGWYNSFFSPMTGYDDIGVVYNFVTDDDPPTIYTKSVTNIMCNSATCGGIITDDGGAPVTARGSCWNTTGTPTIANPSTNDGTGTGSFNSYITGLLPETTYYLRAYATNSAGTGYGSQKIFTTPACPCVPPTVITNPVADITCNSATFLGNVTDDGGCNVTSKGFCWSTSGIPNIADNPIVCGSGTGAFLYQISLEPETTYWICAWAINSEGTAYGTPRVLNTPECDGPPWELVWTVPFNPMNFFVYKATIDENDMVAGDWVGLFDIDPNTGLEICVGVGELTAPLIGGEFLEIIASMDDGTNPDTATGFIPGHELIYKLWSPTDGEVGHVDATYPYPGFDEVFVALGTTLVELEGITVITQIFNLDQNWNLISFRGIPFNANMLNIFDSLIINQTLFKVLDQDGNIIIHLPVPPPNGMWYNSIGDLTIPQGYYVKVLSSTSFIFEGMPIDFPFEIPLRESWNMAGFPSEVSQDAMTIVQPLIDDGQLYKVIDDQGDIIIWHPATGQWINSIGNFEPNEGYYINVNTATSLMINESSDAVVPSKILTFNRGEYFVPAYNGNPFMPMHVILQPNEFLEEGDEVAVFDGDVCVGAVQVIPNEPIVVTAAFDDPDTEVQDGFISGHPVTFQIWKKASGELFENVDYTFNSGSELFSPLETMFATLDLLFTGLTGSSNSFTCAVYPNPFNHSAFINLSLMQNAKVEICLFDIRGEKLKIIANSDLSAGLHHIRIEKKDLASGYYILQTTVTMGDDYFQQTDKLIIN